MNRRRFLTLAAGGAAAALAACGDGEFSGVMNNPTGLGVDNPGGGNTSSTIKVGDFPELATTGTLVAIPGKGFAVKRAGAATFVAISTRCTHQGCLCDIKNNAFFCPCHFSEFDVDGKVTVGPAQTDLPVLPASYDAATDILTID